MSSEFKKGPKGFTIDLQTTCILYPNFPEKFPASASLSPKIASHFSDIFWWMSVSFFPKECDLFLCTVSESERDGISELFGVLSSPTVIEIEVRDSERSGNSDFELRLLSRVIEEWDSARGGKSDFDRCFVLSRVIDVCVSARGGNSEFDCFFGVTPWCCPSDLDCFGASTRGGNSDTDWLFGVSSRVDTSDVDWCFGVSSRGWIPEVDLFGDLLESRYKGWEAARGGNSEIDFFGVSSRVDNSDVDCFFGDLLDFWDFFFSFLLDLLPESRVQICRCCFCMMMKMS